MTISEVAQVTKLTKKAIRYYENVGLFKSKVAANGYRKYSQENVEQLMLIKTLRGLSFSIEEIKLCLSDENNVYSTFSKKVNQLQDDLLQLNLTIDVLKNFINNNDLISNISKYQCNQGTNINNINLQNIFPGDFGEVISVIYGQFLDEPIVNINQKKAYNALVNELDDLDSIIIPKELSKWAKDINSSKKKEIARNFKNLKAQYSQDYDTFSKNKIDLIESYLSFDSNVDPVNVNEALTLFLANEGKAVVNIFEKYLPKISKSYENIIIKQKQFFDDNPELIERLKKRT